jgi:hypothetical protein
MYVLEMLRRWKINMHNFVIVMLVFFFHLHTLVFIFNIKNCETIVGMGW